MIIRDGEPWFVAADVGAMLGIVQPHHAVGRLDEDERTLHNMEGASNGLPANGINESGVYRHQGRGWCNRLYA